MSRLGDVDAFLRDKLRAPTGTTHDAPDGGDRQLQDAADELAAQANDLPYSPPLPVPIGRPEDVSDTRRLPASEVWLINPPTTLPGLGNLVGGGTSEKGSQFAINSIRVDNLSGQWVYFPELGAWVPPNWYGRVMRSDGGRIQRVRFETPGGITALTVDTSEIVRVVFSADTWDETDGENIAGAAPTLPSNVVIGGDAGQAQTAAYADTGVATLLGLITNARMQALNSGGSVDRLRTQVADGSTFLGVLNVQPTNRLAGAATSLVTESYGSPLADARTNSVNAAVAAALTYGFGGSTWNRLRIPNVFKQVANVAIGAGSAVTVWTPAAGLKPRLMGWVVTGSSGLADAAVTFFETSTTGTFMGEVGFLAGIETPAYANYMGGGPIVSTSSAVIVAFSSTGLTLRGTLFGTEE